MGPIGWLGLGIVGAATEEVQDGDLTVTWDCWKPIVHEESPVPSKGMRIEDLVAHPNVTRLTFHPDHAEGINRWGEAFLVTPVRLPCQKTALHAELVATA